MAWRSPAWSPATATTNSLPRSSRGSRPDLLVISDRYVPSSLVLQRMDDVDQDTIWQLNKGV